MPKILYKTQGRCAICNMPCTIEPIERLRKGIRLRAIHEDDSTHEYSQFNSLEDMGRQAKNNPIRIICPRCGKRGRVGEFHSHTGKRKEITNFYIAHEKIGGTWGTGKGKTNRVRRCYIYNTDKASREIIFKKLGRYIK